MTDNERIERYETLLKQAKAMLADENDLTANMANLSALLHDTFSWWWVGFYRVQGEQLILGPFQGPIACTRIPFGRGVCGTAWRQRRTIIVPDVEQFPGHIACSSLSRSEIVVPIFQGNNIVAVLDIDSQHLDTFNDTDQRFLEKIVQLLYPVETTQDSTH